MAGTAITPAVTVQIQDAAGNPISDDNTTEVTLAIGTNPSGGTLSGADTATASGGLAVFSDLSIDKAGTGYTLSASSPDLTGDVSEEFNIITGTGSRLVLSGSTADLASGDTRDLTATVQDEYGNTVTTWNNTITFSRIDGTGSLAGLGGRFLSGGAAVQTVTGWLAGQVTVRASVSDSMIVSNTLSWDVTAGPPSKLVFSTQPGWATPGDLLDPQPVVLVEDEAGNIITDDNTTQVTLSILNNPTGATLGGTKTVTVSHGQAAFTDLSVNKTGTAYTLRATSSPARTPAASSSFDIGKLNSTTTTKPSALTLMLGQSVTDTATVSGPEDLSLTPAGTVTFQVSRNGTTWTTYGPARTLVGGSATSSPYTPNALGTWYFRAIYNGSTKHNGSQSGNPAEPLTVIKGNPAVATSLNPTALNLGSSVTDSAIVSAPASGCPKPTGTATFQVSIDGGATWTTYSANRTLKNGAATSASYIPTRAGTVYFRAVYSGDSNYNSAQSGDRAEPLKVNKGNLTITTTPSTYTLSPGGSLTARAALGTLGAAFPTPTGTVTFQVSSNNGTTWTTFGAAKPLANRSATSDAYKPAQAGNFIFRAIYSGDASYNLAQSSSQPKPLKVNKAASTTTTVLSSSSIKLGASVTDTATVKGFTGFPTPSGKVTFQVSTNGGTTWKAYGGVKTLVNGKATSDAYKPAQKGNCLFRAVYAGDTNYNTSQSGNKDEPLKVS